MLDFHRGLIADETRTLAFRDAIRATVKPGDIVVDLGCGSGILSFFAIEAGAARVYAIEKQHTADAAALLARHNGLGDRIVVMHDYSLEADVPERANVLITETLGNLAFDEQILGLVLDARERYLAADGAILPRRITVSAVPAEIPELFDRHIAWWSEPRYGVDLSPLRTFAANVIYATDLDSSRFLAEPLEIMGVDLATIATPDTQGEARFRAARDGMLHGFGGWFTATIAPEIVLSNRHPGATRWQQAFLPLETPIALRTGDEIAFRLETHDGRAWRWRGRAAGRDFDQTTWLSAPPCTLLAT